MPRSKQRLISAEDLYKLQVLSDVRISPDGRHAVYTLQRVDPKSEKKFTNLWIVPTAGGEPRQFTYGDQNDSQPRWSPDGRQIAFFSNRADKEKPPQIYLIPLEGGEAHPLTEIQGSISDISWSPDGKRLLCPVRKMDPDAIEREKDEQKKKLGVVQRHYDRVFYKLDGAGYQPRERTHLWSVDARTGRAKQLTDGPVHDEDGGVWSPDSRWIAYVSNRAPMPDLEPDLVDLFVMPASGGEARKIETPIGEVSMPSFSPDGRWIAYYGVEGRYQWYKNNSLWIVPADGSAMPTNLTERYDLHVSPWTINDIGQPELMRATWSADSQVLYFPVVQNGSALLMSISTTGDNLNTLIGPGGVVGSFTFDASQSKMAYSYGTIDNPTQVCLLEMGSGQVRRLASPNQVVFDQLNLGTIEEVWIKGAGEQPLQGWILKPPGFDPDRKYPSILEIHGGPQTQYGNLFMHEFYYLAAAGYVVHFCNPRGGRGYGEAHTKAIWGGWGDADFADLMVWTDFVSQKPYIDPQLMGVTGGSYGGYMTVWIIGHTQRFKAAVAQRCVSNLISMWGSSDFNWTFQIELNNKPPFDDLQKFWDHSPIKYIGNASTPTLIIHNENDMRCPIEQGEQVFVALQRLGVPSEMVRFPDEFHGLSRTGRADRRIARLSHIKRWFDRYLKGQ